MLDLGRHDGARIDPAAQRFALGPGTRDSRQDAAMDGHQLDLALSAGRHAVERAKLDGVSLIWAQGQGVGSTVTNQLWRQLLQSGSQRVQPGLGSVAAASLPEAAAIDASCILRRYASALSDPYRALGCLGGFEHAALVGSALAAAQLGLRWIAVGESAEIARRLALVLNPSVELWLRAEWSECCLGPATADRSADPCLQ
ncbi:nicotinate-nucleotide--dimethylbenzimidazole phosphoribosyltransferase [Halochromatium sp.]